MSSAFSDRLRKNARHLGRWAERDGLTLRTVLGDMRDLSAFTDATFDVVTSQHVQMNVADKALLYQEARRAMDLVVQGVQQ